MVKQESIIRPILYNYFDKAADVLMAQYRRSKEQKSSANLGKNRELFCKEFLSKILPPKLKVDSGEIWDSESHKTGQLDVVISRDDCPSLHIGSDNIFLSEGVMAVIEVKSVLDRNKLKEAGKSLLSVSELKVNIGATISCGEALERPLRLVFAYEGALWETLLKEIQQNNWVELFEGFIVL